MILAIETSTMSGSVALTDGDRSLHEIAWEGKEGHTRQLMPAIEQLMKCCHCERSEAISRDSIGAVAVAIGPGSFTGLRVGLATAKGLALGWDKPLVAVSSLAAMVLHAECHAGLIVPMFDARRGEIYMAAYASPLLCKHVLSEVEGEGPGEVDPVVIPEHVATAESIAKILVGRSAPCTCFGDGYLKYASVFKEVLGARCLGLGTNCHMPRAAFVGRLAATKLARGDVADVATIVPNYLRRPQAEEKRSA